MRGYVGISKSRRKSWSLFRVLSTPSSRSRMSSNLQTLDPDVQNPHSIWDHPKPRAHSTCLHSVRFTPGERFRLPNTPTAPDPGSETLALTPNVNSNSNSTVHRAGGLLQAFVTFVLSDEALLHYSLEGLIPLPTTSRQAYSTSVALNMRIAAGTLAPLRVLNLNIGPFHATDVQRPLLSVCSSAFSSRFESRDE